MSSTLRIGIFCVSLTAVQVSPASKFDFRAFYARISASRASFSELRDFSICISKKLEGIRRKILNTVLCLNMPRGKVPKYDTIEKVQAYFDDIGVPVLGLVVDGKDVPFDRVPTPKMRVILGCSVEGCDGETRSIWKGLSVKCTGKCKPCSANKCKVDYYQKFVDLLNEKDHKMISGRSEYKSNKTDMTVECSSGHVYKTTLNRLGSDHGCKECHNGARKVAPKDIKQRFEEKGFVLETQKYVDNKTPMKCICRCGRRILKSVSNLREGTYGCKDCVNKYIPSEIEDMCDEAGCILVKGEADKEFFINSSTIQYYCACGNPELAHTTVKYFRKGTRCGECVKRQIEETNLDRYGTANVGASQHTKEKSKKTNLEKRGVEHHSQDKECRDRTTRTCIEKYGGVGNAGTLREKYTKVCMERYGKDFHLHTEHFQKVMMERYGVIHPVQNAELFSRKLRSSFAYKMYQFPSGRKEEIQGYEHKALDDLLKAGIHEDDIVVGLDNVPSVWYRNGSGALHKYYPDIYIRSLDKLVEVKSPYTFSLDEEKNANKFIAASKAHKFETWVYSDKCKVRTIVCTANTLVSFWGI